MIFSKKNFLRSKTRLLLMTGSHDSRRAPELFVDPNDKDDGLLDQYLFNESFFRRTKKSYRSYKI